MANNGFKGLYTITTEGYERPKEDFSKHLRKLQEPYWPI